MRRLSVHQGKLLCCDCLHGIKQGSSTAASRRSVLRLVCESIAISIPWGWMVLGRVIRTAIHELKVLASFSTFCFKFKAQRLLERPFSYSTRRHRPSFPSACQDALVELGGDDLCGWESTHHGFISNLGNLGMIGEMGIRRGLRRFVAPRLKHVHVGWEC